MLRGSRSFRTRLRECIGVIIDSTAATGGLEWELEVARTLVPADRIVSLLPVGEISRLPGAAIYYRLGQYGLTAAALVAWATNLQHRIVGAPSPMQAPTGLPRRPENHP